MSAPSLSSLPSSTRPERPARRSIQTLLARDAYDLTGPPVERGGVLPRLVAVPNRG
jgi:hypothetical protein